MKQHTSPPPRILKTSVVLVSSALVLAALAPAQGPCSDVAFAARSAASADAQAALYTAIGNAQNIADPAERQSTVFDAFDDYFDALDEIDDQHEARLELCMRLGGGRYAPEIDPLDFVTVIDNPYLPYLPGATRSYRKTLPNGDTEDVEITVLSETREILGVECTIVRDVARENGEVVEETLDYFAQDVHGNVWYFGEIAMNFEEGYLHDLDGSWIAGEDEASPGILMFANPVVGTTYRQEFLLGEAEDAAIVLALGTAASVPAGAFTGCLETFDFTPLEADAREQKTYAPGIGVVAEVDLDSGERLELIAYTL